VKRIDFEADEPGCENDTCTWEEPEEPPGFVLAVITVSMMLFNSAQGRKTESKGSGPALRDLEDVQGT
jgi:hypothetical protein